MEVTPPAGLRYALMNRGAFFLREDPPVLFSYPTRNAFREELIWMLWQSGQRL